MSDFEARTFSAAWKNSDDERRHITKGQYQAIQVLRIYPQESTETGFSRIVLFAAGRKERQVFPLTHKKHGDAIQVFSPIRIHLRVSDSIEEVRDVVLCVYLYVFDGTAHIDCFLIREW